jgi:hypothetical protein
MRERIGAAGRTAHQVVVSCRVARELFRLLGARHSEPDARSLWVKLTPQAQSALPALRARIGRELRSRDIYPDSTWRNTSPFVSGDNTLPSPVGLSHLNYASQMIRGACQPEGRSTRDPCGDVICQPAVQPSVR